MKILDIAWKDIKHTYKSVFSFVMMFGAPLLIAGLLYFAFGGLANGGDSFNLPVTKVQVVNLDQPEAASSGLAAGDMLVDFLMDESLSDVLSVSLAESEAGARAAVDEQKAGVAIIIPVEFSSAVVLPNLTGAVTLYQDPTLTIGPGIVKDLLNHFMDGFSGAKITSQVAVDQLRASGVAVDPSLNYQLAQQYTQWRQASEHGSEGETDSQVSVVSPVSGAEPVNQGAALIGPVMAGMIIFFVFFMGANGAESIILEDEQGTLARLFTTPASIPSILGGKVLGVLVSLCIQVILLLLASQVLFGIRWGHPVTILLVMLGLVIASGGFGLMVMSFIKNSRQTGPVLGGVMTLTGMLGGLITTGLPNLPASFETVTLLTPQGWALQGLKQALTGASPDQVLVPVLVTLASGFVFFVVGTLIFRKRFS